jgi:hydroxyacylglutathione hydrolase
MVPPVDIHTLTVGVFASNCHIVVRAGSRRALVVDPGDDAPAIQAHLRARGLTVAAYLVTHGHMDHVAALAAMAHAFPAPIGMHPADARWAFTPRNSMPPYYDTPIAPPSIERSWAEGASWCDDELTYRILELPGHSPGSVGFWFEELGLIFPGDVLFAGAVGRTDLAGGHAPHLARSLQRLMLLPDATRVFPGHGDDTTIGQEKRSNPFLRDLSWAGPMGV